MALTVLFIKLKNKITFSEKKWLVLCNAHAQTEPSSISTKSKLNSDNLGSSLRRVTIIKTIDI